MVRRRVKASRPAPVAWAAVVLVALATVGGVRADAPAPLRFAEAVDFGLGELYIDTDDGPRQFTVEIARTEAQRARGLMYRAELAPGTGMLFLFDPIREATMWMRNTFIPLDMLFIAADGRIVGIAADTTPLSEAVIASGAPVRAVLELAAGSAARLGIRPGHRVRSDALAMTP